ncbi:unnamed protein product, partial [Mesorhabditis belari]|uniref:ZP domain-containing protein n=1 Tax=Mesorhabditis belari TaxID=2138241 RepID=A0AAF3F5C9_9BILA
MESAVLSRPEVECGVDSVTIHLQLFPLFRGRLFVLGHSHSERCQQGAETESSTKFTLPFGACGMRRVRSLHPRGVTYSFSLVVSAHPVFVTGADRAFAVKCFFREDVRDLHQKVEIGALSTESLDEEFEPPRCTYELRAESGEELQFARVGQPVVHSWTCHPDVPSVFGLLIHSCVVEDGSGEHFELIDSNGCSTDPLLLPPLDYAVHSLAARVHSRIFKFADKVQVYFRCSVQLCFRHDGGCEGVTPPICHGGPEQGSGSNLAIPPANTGEHAAAKGNTILKGKPILVANNIEKISQTTPTTPETRHVRALQSELSVDVLVLPFEKSLDGNETALESSSSQQQICLSKISTLALSTSILLLFFIGFGLGHLLTRKCFFGIRDTNRESTYKAFDQ